MSRFSLKTLFIIVTLCGLGVAGVRLLMMHPVFLGIPIFLGFFAAFVMVLEYVTCVESKWLRLTIICAFPIVFLSVIATFSIFILEMHQQYFK